MKQLMKQSIYVLMVLLTLHASFPLEASQTDTEMREVIIPIPTALPTGTSSDQRRPNDASFPNAIPDPSNAAPPSSNEAAIILESVLTSFGGDGGAEPRQPNEVLLSSSNPEEEEAQQDVKEMIRNLSVQVKDLDILVQQMANTVPNQANSNQEVRDRVFWAWKLWICGENFFNITGRIAWVVVITCTALSKWSLFPPEMREALALTGFLASAYVGISLLLGGYAGRLRHKKGAVVKGRKPSGGVIPSARLAHDKVN